MNGLIGIILSLLTTILIGAGLVVQYHEQKTQDYSIDIHDSGDHTCKLKDLRSGEVYTVPFDSLEQTIIKLNQ